MQQQDVAELLRASASDAGAVAQYLVSIDCEELNGLLDGFAAYEVKKKNDQQHQQRGDWLALVQLLLRSETARLRTATRIIQLVWNGSASELECMQWLTEISLGYLGALEDDTSNSSSFHGDRSASSSLTTRIRFAAIADEVRMLLRIVFELLSDGIETHGTAHARKALPQMLSLLPILLSVLIELVVSDGGNATEKSEQELHENLVKLLELPWTTRSIPLLLDLLKESASIVSTGGWTQLQENLERMVTGTEELPSESMNPIIRECVSIASVTGDAHWIDIARHVFRQLPPRLRQEAEFNLQMVAYVLTPVSSPMSIDQCLHQSPNAVALVCESVRTSLERESNGSSDEQEHESPEGSGGELKLLLDWRDLVFLFHALQVSRPILHHRTTSSRIATDATVFMGIEKLTWAILRLDLDRYQSGKATDNGATDSSALDLPKYLAERVTQLLVFGGKQVHSREWKALLLMDFAFYWMESDATRVKKPNGGALFEEEQVEVASAWIPSKDTLARFLLLAVFQTAPEIRSEMLSSLFEGAKCPERAQVAGKALDQLFCSQPAALFPHLNAIQDWLSVLFQSHFGSARAFFLMASQLTTVHKDLYSFLMVFLRKLLSVTNSAHQQFAIDLWCSWIERGFRFDVMQEEEIVSALKNSLLVCQGSRAWALGRLEQLFHLDKHGNANLKLRRSSWEELHRLFSGELSQFLRPASTAQGLSADSHDERYVDDDDENSSSRRHHFQLSALDHFYRQNSSADGAAAVGLVFQKALSCLLSFEAAAANAQVTSEDGLLLSLPAIGADMLQWVVDFVSNWEFFFHWIAQSSDDEDGSDSNAEGDFGVPRGRTPDTKALSTKVMWRLLSRIGIGSALCSVAIEQQLRRDSTTSSVEIGGDLVSSIWPLLEVQLCLHRLLRKLVTTHSAIIDVKQSKEYLAASFYGISSVIDARSAQILGKISSRLAGESPSLDSGERDVIVIGSGLSFDSMLFVLENCCNGTAAPAAAEAGLLSPMSSFETRSCVLKALVKLYVTVRDQVFSRSTLSGTAAADSEPRSVFTVYADSLVLKFPKSLRHLVTAPKSAKQVVLLDAKAAEDVLVRIFSAIGRTLDRMTEETGGVKATDRTVLRLMTTKADRRAHGENSGVLALAAVFVQDLKAIMAQNELTKLKLTTALLVKRLCDLGADVPASSNKDEGALGSQLLDLSLASYDIMCEHAVYHAPLLRALLAICFCVHIGKDADSVVKLAGCMESFLLASGFEVTLVSAIRRLSRRARRRTKRNSTTASPTPEPYANQEPVTPSKRKRLRQIPAAVPNPLMYESDEDDDEEAESVLRQPHLPSSEAQSAAVLALLTLVEAAQSTLFRQLSIAKLSGQRADHRDNTATTVQCTHTFELVLRALLTAKDASWVSSAKVLLKLLSVIEWSLRIGKVSCSSGGTSPGFRKLRRSDAEHDSNSSRSSVDILDGAVQIALQARVWVDLLKENIKESATKTKLSATSLKIDVFLLDVPQLIESFSRDVQTPLTEPLCDRIRAMLAQVTDRMTPLFANGNTPSKKLRGVVNAHMLGVVPIVKKRKKRLRSRHPYIDDWLRDEDGSDAYADLEDFIE